MKPQLLFAFIAYFTVLLSIGLICHKKLRSSADFIVGNRSLNFWLTALSAHASDMSNWLFMAYPAAIMMSGMSQAWIAIGLVVGMWLNWQFMAKKLRDATEKHDSYTLPTYFERRLNDPGILRVLTASICIFFLTCYLSAGLIGMGLLFENVFGIDYYVGLSIALCVAVIYTFYGGYVTVAWTDLFQALFLLFCIVVTPFIALSLIPDGVNAIPKTAAEMGISLSLFKDQSWSEILSSIMLIGWGFGYWGQPHILTKFMGIKDSSHMYKAKYVGMTWQILCLTAATVIGLVGIAFFQGGLHNPELIFIALVQSVYHPLIAGFVLCAILAATISTMDSQILVCASVLSEDFYKKLISPSATDKQILTVSRIGVILISLVALTLAFEKSVTVLEAVEYAWTGLGASFGPLLLTSLYSNKINRWGGLAGILVGSIVTICWPWTNPYLTTVHIHSMIPAFFLSLFSILAVSKATESVCPAIAE
jgi:sodium/proline symporter